MPMTPVDKFIEILEADAKKYDELANNLETLIPEFSGADQSAWATLEVEQRRTYANRLRLLAEMTRAQHGG